MTCSMTEVVRGVAHADGVGENQEPLLLSSLEALWNMIPTGMAPQRKGVEMP